MPAETRRDYAHTTQEALGVQGSNPGATGCHVLDFYFKTAEGAAHQIELNSESYRVDLTCRRNKIHVNKEIILLSCDLICTLSSRGRSNLIDTAIYRIVVLEEAQRHLGIEPRIQRLRTLSRFAF